MRHRGAAVIRHDLIEPARSGGHNVRTREEDRNLLRDLDEQDGGPDRAPMRVRGYDRKEQTDSFSHLRRYMRKNIGRPWDKVFSELCAVNDPRNIRGYHVRQHIPDVVHAGDVAFDSHGVYVVNPKFNMGTRRYLRRGEFYVDGRGLLQVSNGQRDESKNASKSARDKKLAEIFNEEGKFTHVLTDAGWFEVVRRKPYAVRDGLVAWEKGKPDFTLANRDAKRWKWQNDTTYFQFVPHFYWCVGMERFMLVKDQETAKSVEPRSGFASYYSVSVYGKSWRAMSRNEIKRLRRAS